MKLVRARGLAGKHGFSSQYYYKLRHRGYMPADEMIDARYDDVLRRLRMKLNAGLTLSAAFAQAEAESGLRERSEMQKFECDGCGCSLPSEEDGEPKIMLEFDSMAVTMSLQCECPRSGEKMHFCISCTKRAVAALDQRLNRPSDVTVLYGNSISFYRQA